MFRKAISDLVEWKSSKRRKPLIIRGPRQAGKTWLVRDFAKREFENLIEINFDQTPDKSKFLTNPSIERCLELIEVDSGRELIPEKTLLFLDEIQAAPDALPRLRYFYEERPDIPIVAAGSLLEFLLADHDFSMPVGRVEYLHLGPMDFEEFLMARGKKKLVEFLERFSVEEEIPDSIHAGLLDELRLFWVVGGMPAPVKSFLESGGTREMASEHESLLQTYEDDFSKYRDRVDPERLQTVLRKIPGLIGNKLKYSRIDPEDRAKNLSDALKQLEKARVLHRVFHSSGNGVPLGAEADDSDFKALFLDIGLVSTSLGLDLVSISSMEDLLMVNEGALAEQFIGQHLLYRGPTYRRPELFYWNREKPGSSAEVDYLISVGTQVVPVEVKSGKSGRLRSLQVFVSEKKVPLAVRFNTKPPKLSRLKTSVAGMEETSYLLLSLPLYLVGQVERLCKEALKSGLDDRNLET